MKNGPDIVMKDFMEKRVWVVNDEVLTLKKIADIVRPIAIKYNIKEIYLFGSYARGEATGESDLDFLVFGGDQFRLTMIFAVAEELRAAFDKEVDVFEIHEINQDSTFYQTIMRERLLVA
ncbi:MAG: nucleotidyltransferase domain-containing protein [Clostridiales bacterium]|nr:nucleotidyltransferase domain-containing protein [Clostridiales bacterium]